MNKNKQQKIILEAFRLMYRNNELKPVPYPFPFDDNGNPRERTLWKILPDKKQKL